MKTSDIEQDIDCASSSTTMVVHSAPPSIALRPYVRAYAERRVPANLLLHEPMPARLEQLLEFEFGTPVEVTMSSPCFMTSSSISVMGSYTGTGAWLRLRGGVHSFAIFFGASGLSRLFRIPAAVLTDNAVEGEAALGRPMTMLREELGRAGCFSDRVRIAERFLLGLCGQASMRATMPRAAEDILNRDGGLRISSLAAAYGLSSGQFEKRFAKEIGVRPKLFARIARFQSALDRKTAAPDTTWREIAHELQYHDQMHMIHDFVKLAGESPSKFFSMLGAARPLALGLGTDMGFGGAELV